MLRKSLLIAASLCLFANAIQAEPSPDFPRMPCHNAREIAKKLKERYKEHPVAFGLQSNGNLLQVYANNETFTVVSTSPAGISCIVAVGEHWEMLHHIPEGSMT